MDTFPYFLQLMHWCDVTARWLWLGFWEYFSSQQLQDIVTFLSRTEAGGGNGKQYAVSEGGREGSLAAHRKMKKFSWPGS